MSDIDPDRLPCLLRGAAPACDFWSARHLTVRSEWLGLRQGVLLPPRRSHSTGLYVEVVVGEGVGYAATSDVTPGGLRAAFRAARDWAEASGGRLAFATADLPRSTARGHWATPVRQPWAALDLPARLDLLRQADAALDQGAEIVDRLASLAHERRELRYLNAAGADLRQVFDTVAPGLRAVASRGGLTQVRTGQGLWAGRQGGVEQLAALGFPAEAERVAREARALLDAAPCPAGRRHALILADQMLLQVHESIGHPLELDRILGDERNYAGDSFVTPDMFGRYRYGAPCLNVTFDPAVPGELAGYRWDDDGQPAERQYLIRDGILLRGIGGWLSQRRAGLPGVAASRACDWNRPPIDRMGNINIEPGSDDLDALVARVEDGVLLATNRSWSIDQSRNKFQFGCEIAWRIRDGERRELLRDPNYRGVSADFWRNLVAVGDAGTRQVSGVANCGKGEPNQMIAVGHAAPACLFRDVALFGGAA